MHSPLVASVQLRTTRVPKLHEERAILREDGKQGTERAAVAGACTRAQADCLAKGWKMYARERQTGKSHTVKETINSTTILPTSCLLERALRSGSASRAPECTVTVLQFTLCKIVY